MPLIGPSGVTVTLAANSTSGTFAGDLSAANIQVGMELFIGSRNGRVGNGRILTEYVVNGSTGATFKIAEAFGATAYTAQPFVIDNFAAPISVAAQNSLSLTILLNALRRATGLSTTLDMPSKTWQLDRGAGSGTFSQWLFSLAGRLWFAFEQRAVSGVERFFLRSYPNGTDPVDSIDIDGATGGVKTLSVEGSVASAATTDLSVPRTDRVLVTGTTTITSLGSAKWQKILVGFSGALVLTHNATSLILPGGANITTAAGDTALFTSDGSGNWTCESYDRANGRPVSGLGTQVPNEVILSGVGNVLRVEGTSLASIMQIKGDSQPVASAVPGDHQGNGQLLILGKTNGAKRMALGIDTTISAMACFIQSIEAAVTSRALSLNPSGGNVGIGTMSPTERLTVAGNVVPVADATNYCGKAGARWLEVWAVNLRVDDNYAMFVQGSDPLLNFDAGDYLFYGRSSNLFGINIGSNTPLLVDSSAVFGGGDGVVSSGKASNRWSTVYAATGTINTSDQKQKTPRRDFTDIELDAWGDVKGGVFQFLDAVEAKGEDHARLHFGYIAQEVEAAFRARGIDPARCALWCADPEMRRVTKIRKISAQATDTVEVEDLTIVIEDGQPVQHLVPRIERRPRVLMVPVMDADGRPVTHEVQATDADGELLWRDVPARDDRGEVIRDEAGEVVMGREPVYRPEPTLHPVPVMEEVDEPYEEDEPTGETRLGLRYDQCAVIEASWQRRRGDRMQTQIDVLSAMVADAA